MKKTKNKTKHVIRNSLTKNSELCSCRGDSALVDTFTGVSSSVFMTDSRDRQRVVDEQATPLIDATDGNSQILDKTNSRET